MEQRDEPWMILSDGLNRGLVCLTSAISARSLSRMFFAIAVPSILVAAIVALEVAEPEKDLIERFAEWR